MAEDIIVRIPPELTAAMIIRAGVIADEARALELATELHEIVPKLLALWLAEKRRLVELPDDPDEEPTVLEQARKPNALEIADFTLAVWRQAVRNSKDDGPDSPDRAEAGWISEELACLGADDLYLRWLMIGDIVTDGHVADLEGGVQ
jgi:hypothetical protein